MSGVDDVCSICGRMLPTKHAVAGRCEADGCGRLFCSLHWNNGNRRCREHGWVPGGILAPEGIEPKEEKMENGNENGKELCERAAQELQPEKKESIIKAIAEFTVKLGQGAGQLAKKISGYRSPDEAMSEIDAQIASNREKRGPLSQRYEELYGNIVLKKKAYQAAPPARRKILEMELKSMIAEYQSLERQVAAYLNNEMVLTKVKGRMCELVAISLKTVKEADIDKLVDKVDEAVATSEDIDGAIKDLDNAGARSERDDGGAFEELLSGFGDEVPDGPNATDPLPDIAPPQKEASPLEV